MWMQERQHVSSGLVQWMLMGLTALGLGQWAGMQLESLGEGSRSSENHQMRPEKSMVVRMHCCWCYLLLC